MAIRTERLQEHQRRRRLLRGPQLRRHQAKSPKKSRPHAVPRALTSGRIARIRNAWLTGDWKSERELADSFGISVAVLHAIVPALSLARPPTPARKRPPKRKKKRRKRRRRKRRRKPVDKSGQRRYRRGKIRILLEHAVSPSQAKILELCRKGWKTQRDLSEALGLNRKTISVHMPRLEAAELIEKRKARGPYRAKVDGVFLRPARCQICRRQTFAACCCGVVPLVYVTN